MKGSDSIKKEVVLNLGKNGLTKNFIDEVKTHIYKGSRVRVKVLKSALGGTTAKELASEISGKARCGKVDVRGHVIVLER
ncbi:MAG TPA: RNA-binding protein [Candidatus Altiarchaeales archaeon]|nr:RNA-binding protein [Candidatus Altiarchaeales archaeon]